MTMICVLFMSVTISPHFCMHKNLVFPSPIVTCKRTKNMRKKHEWNSKRHVENEMEWVSQKKSDCGEKGEKKLSQIWFETFPEYPATCEWNRVTVLY